MDVPDKSDCQGSGLTSLTGSSGTDAPRAYVPDVGDGASGGCRRGAGAIASAPRRSSIDRFDASVEEGTFGGYEAFGVYSEDAGSGRSSEYEIFIVSTGAEF